ncbi:hypothetical protein SD235_11570 [Burkholderia cepacia]|uniref:hypothetical protein n=1 Tax=Burkholderia cepacia TaxID=292 RepID=UPI003A4E49B1
MAYISTNPYLEARCSFVLAKLALIGAPDAEDTTYEAMLDAQALGSQDAERCHEQGTDMDVPAFFADVLELKCEWLSGWTWYEDMLDMRDCSGCVTGDPCPFHG